MESTRYLDFYPIKSLYKTFYNNGTLKNISYERMHSNIYSFIETDDFPTKCLEYFFIYKNESCPITEIELKNTKIGCKNYIRINDDEYICYAYGKKIGNLYNDEIMINDKQIKS